MFTLNGKHTSSESSEKPFRPLPHRPPPGPELALRLSSMPFGLPWRDLSGLCGTIGISAAKQEGEKSVSIFAI